MLVGDRLFKPSFRTCSSTVHVPNADRLVSEAEEPADATRAYDGLDEARAHASRSCNADRFDGGPDSAVLAI
eukprot:422600-Pleurochrysis_carterae.AAC.2